MLTNKHLSDEIKSIEDTIQKLKDEGNEFEASMLKAQTLNLKLLQNIRANIVKVMEFNKIPLVKSERTSGEKEQQ